MMIGLDCVSVYVNERAYGGVRVVPHLHVLIVKLFCRWSTTARKLSYEWTIV